MEIKEALEILKNSGLTKYRIAKMGGFSQTSVARWFDGGAPNKFFHKEIIRIAKEIMSNKSE